MLDIALSYDGASNHSAAIFYYNKVIKEADSNMQYATQKAWALDGLGDYVNALKFFKQGLKNNERDIFALDGLGHTMIALKQYTNASLTFGRVLSLPIPKLEQQPGYVEALIGKSAALIYLHDYRVALSYLDRTLALNSHKIDTYYNKGLALQYLGDYIAAIDNYKALALSPNDKDDQYTKRLAIESLGRRR